MRPMTFWIRSTLFATAALLSGASLALADEVQAATEDVAGKTSGLIKTLSNAFRGGEVGAQAQADLIAMCGDATYFIAILFISYLAASWLGRMVGGVVTQKVDVTLGKFLSKAVRNLLLLIVAMVVLEQQFDVQVAGFAAILAAAGFAIGMALQGTLGNFAAGVMLLLFRPFKVDDYIAVAGTAGTVEEIDLFTTRLNSPDNRHLIVPNAEIFGAKLENYSRNPRRRVDVNVGAAYDADLDATRLALTRATNQIAQMAAENATVELPQPQVYLQELGASSVDWQLRVWCHPAEFWDIREQLTAAAKIELDRANIGIPYPQMDVHVVGKVMARAA